MMMLWHWGLVSLRALVQVAILWGCVNSLISPKTFTSSLKNRKEGNLLAIKMLHNEALVTAGRIIVDSKVADLLGFT